MSLLLDALKKAADDKQKASSGSSTDDALDGAKQPDESNIQAGEQPLSAPEGDTSPSQTRAEEPDVVELTLDEIEPAPETPPEPEPDSEKTETETGAPAQQAGDSDAEPLGLKPGEDIVANERQSAFTVSDEALSMLIYKTNQDVKRSRKIVIISMLMISLLVLLAGGGYYYHDTQAEIDALERKHRIAMQSMHAKTSKEKTPTQSAIIRNLVSDSDLNEKVTFAKNKMVNSNNAKSPVNKARAITSASTKAAQSENSLSIQKNKKSDPVGEQLDAAWLAYKDGDYQKASGNYQNVLELEGDNRDAMLGLGAIAVIEKNNTQARKIYTALLEQDPRDAIAIAALTSLQNSTTDLKAEENHLLSMLKKNPQAPQLNFALGNNYASQKNWKSAQQYYFNAWQYNTENADYLYNLAVSLDQLSKPQQAIGFYRDSLSKAGGHQVSFSRDAVKKRIAELSGMSGGQSSDQSGK